MILKISVMNHSKNTLPKPQYPENRSFLLISYVVVVCGNLLTFTGCLSLLMGVLGVYDMELFSLGLSSGIRIIGSVGIAGCLLSAIGYGSLDHFKK